MAKRFIAFSVLASLSLVEANTASEIHDFKSLLDNASEIATRKSLNVDYLPSVVTVIDGNTFVDTGIQTLSEALDMLPGIQMQLSPTGYTMTTVRGLKNPNAYLSDKVKILVDGVAINNEVLGSSHFYMDFPMQLVSKIEVLRGPNSTLYGAGAFYGTINIVTKLGNSTGENQLYLGTGSYRYQTAGSNINTSLGNWKLFADGYYKKNDKELDVKNEVRKTDEAMRDYSVGFKAVNEGFEFLTRFKQNSYGNFYSYEGLLNPIPAKDEDHTNSYFFSQLSYKTQLDGYKLETKANFSQRKLDATHNMGSVQEIANKFSVVGINMQEGFYTHEKSQEDNLEAEVILTLPPLKSNDILVGAGVRRVTITKDSFYSSIEDVITQNMTDIVNHPNYNNFRYRQAKEPAFWANPTTTLLPKDTHRSVGYGYIQDLISVTEDVDLLLGVRVDDYSDYRMQLSKRAGLVYRATDTTIFKLLYGSAFRTPTLIEAYQNGHINTRAGDRNIAAEETDTYEAVGIYTPNFNHKFLLNLFYSHLKNVIDLEESPYTNPGYQNYKQRHSKGAEFEYTYRSGREHNLYFNATYLDTKYTIPPEPNDTTVINQSMPDISKVMLKAMYVYRPIEALSFGTAWRYFSETTETQLAWVTNDSTSNPINIFDETLTYRFSPTSELRLTVKNLFNADVNQPSYYYEVDGGVRREGRNFFLGYAQRF